MKIQICDLCAKEGKITEANCHTKIRGGRARVDTCVQHKGFFRGKDMKVFLKSAEEAENLDLMCNKEGEIRFSEKYNMKDIKVTELKLAPINA